MRPGCCSRGAGSTRRSAQAGLEALQHYRRDYNSRLNEFKAVPVHDWASHAGRCLPVSGGAAAAAESRSGRIRFCAGGRLRRGFWIMDGVMGKAGIVGGSAKSAGYGAE